MHLNVYNAKVDENQSFLINLHTYFTDRMNHTDRFLHILSDYKSSLLPTFIEKFQINLKSLINPDYLPKSIENIDLSFNANSILEHQEELIYTLEKAMFSFMHFREYEGSFTDATSVSLKFDHHYRGIFLGEYYMAQTLCELIPRPEALELIKRYTRGYYVEPDFSPKHEASLEDHAQNSIRGSALTHQALYHCDNKRLFFKVERCLYGEVIQDLPDNELKYYLECYGDYFNHVQKNENFVLTRTKTIMKGDDCCDFCYHDKRYIEEIFHPSDSEWQQKEREVKHISKD
ncbi:hypothetical protein NEF87_003062 [Candidatus Lokiarchaeum ossiferum]|uniref:L-2-amino-thiazoline-4-carboxylic acid hydrolase n=1 Tax=Candidatus Lokiarchaeum ossiferum TaxID=2951803 RepID=A0ABY6HWQ1_9ARCH|nr:hypothetical protein NEF87_003062 [Candidatus Lokiarchaeum sp. B-35]